MTDLTKEQEAALVEALETGDSIDAETVGRLFMSREEIERQGPTLPAFNAVLYTSFPAVIYRLRTAGRLLAQALKERDEARNERDVTHRALIELVTQGVPALIARVEELEELAGRPQVAEYSDDKTSERYMTLLAYAVESFGVDVQSVGLTADGVIVCTAKSQVDEVALAEQVGRTVSAALRVVRSQGLQQAKADAWDEGYAAGSDAQRSLTIHANPYRKDGA